MVNVLLARYGKDDGASLHHIVYITMLTKVDKAAPEYGSYFWHWWIDTVTAMSVEEVIDLVEKCVSEIRSRLVVALPNSVIETVDKDGA